MNRSEAYWSMNKAYWEGYEAYKEDKSVNDNPYNAWGAEEPLWEEWKEGYYDAALDD